MMDTRKLQFLAGSVVVGTLTALAVDVAPVQAFSLSQVTNSATFDSGDVAGTSFTIDFNGIINGAVQSGLKAKAVVTLVETFSTGNEAKFSVSLQNTSSSPITTSRLTIFGFDVSKALDLPNTTVSGIFTQVSSGATAQPGATNVLGQPISPLDVCFRAGGMGTGCVGGGNGGIPINGTGVFDFTLKFASNVSSFAISNPYVRYQGINGVSGNSGVGAGKIPTPAMLPGLVGLGLAALRKRRGEQEVEQEESVNV